MSRFSFLDDYSVPRLIFEIAGLQLLDANRLLKRFNITMEQSLLMHHLKINGSMSQKELSDSTLKDQANTARILRRLTEKGFVSIVGSKTDKRVNIVSLTDKGTKLLVDSEPYLESKKQKIKSLFSEEDTEKLHEMLSDYFVFYSEDPEVNNWRKEL